VSRTVDGESGTAVDGEGGERPLLSVADLHTHFDTDEGVVRAVDGVSFDVDRGETVALVGESGSGKTVTGESITRLFRSPPGHIPEGSIRFDGREVTTMSERELRALRGGRVGHVFQNPQNALNPVFTVGWQVREAIELHQDLGRGASRDRAVELLRQVGIPEPGTRLDDYPHELSGGMKQRVMIAMALACNPKLLIADEPTTALDVTIQAQILELLNDLQDEFDMSVMFITHDLGVVAETCDYVGVMYGGRIVEYGDVETIFEDPAHPYTIGLFSSLPQIDVASRRRKDRLYVIPGMVPSPQNFPSGCRFRDRCEYATEQCTQLPPDEELREPKHYSKCWYSEEVRAGDKEQTGPYAAEDDSTTEAAE
jgi:oligopeptide/dipeptide ABC transporter ATP-binding protein